MLEAVLERGLHDPRIPIGPVVAAPGNQPHAVAIALQPEAVAVVLHLLEPLRADRDDGRSGGEAEIKRLKHVPTSSTG